LVEQRIENPRVRGSNPRSGTTSFLKDFQIDVAQQQPADCPIICSELFAIFNSTMRLERK
jgi:hypothetical protein